MTTIAIIGGAGFVGINLARQAQSRGHRVVLVDVADRLGRLRYSGLYDSAECRFIDLAAPGAVLDVKSDVFVHLAALPQVDYSMHHPEEAVVNNTLALSTTLAAARRSGVPVLFTSSIEIYGGNDGPLFDETATPLALSPYAASKIGGEHIVDSYRIGFGLQATTVRLTNLYGPWQAPDRIVPRLIAQALLGEPGEVVVGRIRDFLHVDDAVTALLLMIEGGIWGETYNIAAGFGTSLEFIADTIAATTGSMPFARVETPLRDGRGHSLVASSKRLASATGWAPSVDLREGLAAAAAWYRHNNAWWIPFESQVRSDRTTASFILDHAVPVSA